jgi:Pyridoxamine 5''-phosphate oxidase.
MDRFEEGLAILNERFGRDTAISLATLDGGGPAVRTVDGYYEGGAFYVITDALSNKMRQIEKNPNVAVCGEWFTARGAGENLGYIGSSSNSIIREKLKKAFASWYENGHIDESDPNTCILKILLTNGILFNHGKRYDLDFINRKA